MNINFRKMEECDRDDVYNMMRIFYNSSAVCHKSSEDILKKDIDNCLSNINFVNGFVIEENKKNIGYAMTSISYTTEYGGIIVWLEDLYIKKEHRYHGIAGKFFLFLHRYYPQAVCFKLEVKKENKAAIKAYEKAGYKMSPYLEMINLI